MEKNLKHKVYKDGIAYFGSKTIIRNSNREKTGEEIRQVLYLPFSKVSISSKDLSIAEAKAKKINLKIRVPLQQIELDYKVKINSKFEALDSKELYEIINIDEGADKELFILLQKVKI